MRLRDEIRTDLARIEYEMADETAVGVWSRPTFTWKGASVPCTPSSVRRGLEVLEGGNLITVDLILFVRYDEFRTVDTTLITVDSELYTADDDRPHPISGRTLTFRGRSYRIISARASGPLSHYELSLADAESNR